MNKTAPPGRTLVVEIVGPAGSGKTTLARALAQHAPESQSGLRLPPWKYLPEYAASALSILSIVWGDARRGQGFIRRPEMRMVMRMVYLQVQLAIVQRYTNRPNGVLVLDQGPVYKLAELCDFELDGCRGDAFQRWWQRMVEQWAGVLSLIVCLDAPDDALIQRIGTRDKAHVIKGAPTAAASVYLAKYRTAVQGISDHMCAAAKQSGAPGPTQLRFMSDQTDVEPLVHQVLTALAGQAERVAPITQGDAGRVSSLVRL